MGMLPVPEIVREMAQRIEDMSVSLKFISAKIDVLHQEVAEIRGREKWISELSSKVETLDGRVSTLSDRVAWLCAAMEHRMAVNVSREGHAPGL